jgi:hypothetical protein
MTAHSSAPRGGTLWCWNHSLSSEPGSRGGVGMASIWLFGNAHYVPEHIDRFPAMVRLGLDTGNAGGRWLHLGARHDKQLCLTHQFNPSLCAP